MHVTYIENQCIFYGIYLDSLQIVPCIPQKHHPIPADVLPSDSEELLASLRSAGGFAADWTSFGICFAESFWGISNFRKNGWIQLKTKKYTHHPPNPIPNLRLNSYKNKKKIHTYNNGRMHRKSKRKKVRIFSTFRKKRPPTYWWNLKVNF